MSLKSLFVAAGIGLAALGAAAPASAHDGWYDGGRYNRSYYDNDRRWDGRWDRGDRRDWREHRRWERNHNRYGWRGPRCWTEWRWGHRVRICR